MKDHFPPLLRGIGMLVLLTAGVIAFWIARQHDKASRTLVRPVQIAAGKKSGDSPASSVSGMHEPGLEDPQDEVVEEVLKNPWFECLGFAGTGLFATSFFMEAYIRSKKKPDHARLTT